MTYHRYDKILSDNANVSFKILSARFLLPCSCAYFPNHINVFDDCICIHSKYNCVICNLYVNGDSFAYLQITNLYKTYKSIRIIKWQYALIYYTSKERNFLSSFNIIIQHITDFYLFCSIVALIGDKVYFEYKAKERNQSWWSTHPSNSIYDIS